MNLKADLQQFARERGVDSVGFVSAEAYERKVPNVQKPSTTAAGMRTLIVFVKHMLTGSFATKEVTSQSVNSHLCMDQIERLSMDIADWLESRGYLGIPVPPEAADMDLQRSPAGTLDFKWVAEEAGVGTVGLELNLLTPEFGPRVYLGVVMTDAELEPDPKLADNLCPGMKCGRCAVICPTVAIPLSAPLNAHVNDYRTLNKRACASGAERIGIKPLLLNLERLLFAKRPIETAKVFANPYWRDFWQSVNNKVGAFAACFECFYVCPPGDRDFRRIIRFPYRRRDLPPRSIRRVFTNGTVEMVYVGVPKDRQHEYVRDQDFAGVLNT
jgi:ferredoxin